MSKKPLPGEAAEPVMSPTDEHQIRLEKAKKMRAAGFEPWPTGRTINAIASEVINEFQDGTESRVYEIAGRLMSKREHGKSIFAHILDPGGKIQIYLKQDVIGDERFAWFQHYVDIGDTVWFTGKSFKTRTGEVTIQATEFFLGSKCLWPIPSSFYGIADVEMKYRQRYLDLIVDEESRERFVKRSKLVSLMRRFMEEHQFMEVETPMLHPIPGGALARPFSTHHNTLDMELYLRIAPELYLKRLVVGGFERVYEINRNFRNEGISTKHNPEFTMLEFYAGHEHYPYAMDLTEKMLRFVAQEVSGGLQLAYGDHKLDFEKPFARMSMADAVAQYAGCSVADLQEDTIDAQLKKHKITLANKDAQWGHKLNALFEELVEDKLIQPTYITHFPLAVSPLSKHSEDDERCAARFELFIAGMEIGNGFNELNDPQDQARRFQEQARAHSDGDVEAHHYDADYVRALEYGMPPTVGTGIGIDRLTMLLTGTTSIKDVILFPTLKHKQEGW